MLDKKSKKYCKECEISSVHHIKTWLDEIINLPPSLPKNFLFEKLGRLIDVSAEKFFTGLQIGSMKNDFTSADIQLRSTCFIEEAKKQGQNKDQIKQELIQSGWPKDLVDKYL